MNSTIKPKPCRQCGSIWHSAMHHKPKKPIKTTKLPISSRTGNGLKQRKPLSPPKKRIRQRGKRSYELADWVSNEARPYLITTYGQVCNVVQCFIIEPLDVDHKLNKGSHPELKMSLDNVQLLCRPHHRQKTDGAVLQYKT